MPRSDGPTAPLVEVVITEELDGCTVPRIGALLHDAVALHPVDLFIDLSDCPYIDASAIAMLLDVHRRIWTDGGRLTLRDPSPRVRRTLHLAKVDHVLRIVPATPAGRGDPEPVHDDPAAVGVGT